MMMGRKKTPQAAVIGEYDLVKGLSAFLRSVGIDVKYKLCSHSLKSIVEPELDIQYISVEKEKIEEMIQAAIYSESWKIVKHHDIMLFNQKKCWNNLRKNVYLNLIKKI